MSNRATIFARSLVPLCAWMGLSGLLGLPLVGGRGLWVLVGVWLVALLALGLLLRVPEPRLIAQAERRMTAPRASLLGGVLLLVGLVLFWAGVFGVLRGQTALGVVVLVWVLPWLLLAMALLGDWWRTAQPLFTGLGVVLAFLLVGEGAFRVYDRLQSEDATRIAAVDERPQTWTTITDTELPWAEQYWLEYGYASRATTWTPFVYWRMQPYAGEYVNVNAEGVRRTWQPAGEPQLNVHLYGGSTVWGHGARDDHTLPSELARALEERGTPASVTNFGELGYISSQDAALFAHRLALGDVPDVAIFYWGFNDVNVAHSGGGIGIPSGEPTRAAQFVGGQCVVDLSLPVVFNALLYKTALGAAVLERANILPLNPAEGCRLGNMDWERVNAGLVAQREDDPRLLAQHIAAQTQQVSALGAAYGVRVVVVWQPAIFQKDPLSWYEQQIVEQARWQELGAYYGAVDAALRALVDDGQADVLLWADFFADLDPTINIFIDKAHITEEGNALVAAALAGRVLD